MKESFEKGDKLSSFILEAGFLRVINTSQILKI